MRPSSSVRRAVERVTVAASGETRRTRDDQLAAEEPLEIALVAAGESEGRPLLVTMRTPGADFDLAAGILFSEALVDSGDAIAAIRYCTSGEQLYNRVNVTLAPGFSVDAEALQRAMPQSSACGVCGKASIEAVLRPGAPPVQSDLRLAPGLLLSLPERLRQAQAVFERTGGLHAAGLFSAEGELLRLREDVGRHNALDKLVGASLLAGELPWHDRIVVLSGRIGFELVQKAARAGAAVVAGVSAPTSLAVELAQAAGITLCGFLRGESFNLYTGGARIAAASHPVENHA
jgi:FdhD protein